MFKELQRLVEQRPDWYLDELVLLMDQYCGKKVSIPTLWRSLDYIGISRKAVR
jgi:hypothetical protein